VNETLPTLYEVIEPMLRFYHFGQCAYKMPESPAGARDGGQQLCLAEATVCDLRSRQESCANLSNAAVGRSSVSKWIAALADRRIVGLLSTK
jgi:hypothetical protein